MVFKFSVIILHLLIFFCWNHENYIEMEGTLSHDEHSSFEQELI